jgi:hypothetical protein
MSSWHCGTTGCIAGWAHHLFGGGKETAFTDDLQFDARELLDLPFEIADDLFVPGGGYLRDIKPAKAAAVLRHLAETGKVDWSITP